MVDRTQQILLQLIGAEGRLSAVQIAESLGVSSRTVVAEMPRVSAVLERCGARLVSRRNWGYAIAVVDDEAFGSLKAELDMLSMQIETAGFDETARMLYIARRLIASPAGVHLDAISDELSVSRSALRAPLRRAHRFLESYHLQVASMPGRGVTVRGDEYLLRLAMMELSGAHFHKARLVGVDPGFARIVACEWQERQDIRHAYLEVQRASGLGVRDSRTQRLAMLLIISRNRVRDGHPVSFPVAWMEQFRAMPEFACARRIVDRLSERFSGFDVADEECALIALAMADSLALDSLEDPARWPEEVLCDARELASAVRRGFEAEVGCTLFSTSRAQALLAQALAPLVVEGRYGFDGHECFDHENETLVRSSPLSMALADRLVDIVRRQCPYQVSESHRLVLAALIMMLVLETPFEIRPLRLLVTDAMGREFARVKGEALRERFPDLIAEVSPFELYEIRGLDESSYDAALVDARAVSYNYVYPMARLRHIEWREGFAAIHDKLLVLAYHLDEELFDASRIRAREMPEAASIGEVLYGLGASLACRDATGARSFAERACVVVDLVASRDQERFEVVVWGRERHGARRELVYCAVAPSAGERHLKACERIAYSFREGVPVGFMDDPEGILRDCLRRSIGIQGKGC